MVAELHVEHLPVDQVEALACALCSRSFVPSPNAEMLYTQRMPVGLICPNCCGNPREAAAAARKRAREIRVLARGCERELARDTWIRLVQIAHARADYWDDLAGQIEQLGSWDTDRH